jgi:hypothetical protein
VARGFKFKSTTLNQGHFKLQCKDLNFKRRFSPKDLNSVYFIELKGRLRMEIGGPIGSRNNFQIFLGLSFKVLKIKPRQR